MRNALDDPPVFLIDEISELIDDWIRSPIQAFPFTERTREDEES
jgi:hypothetical protein